MLHQAVLFAFVLGDTNKWVKSVFLLHYYHILLLDKIHLFSYHIIALYYFSEESFMEFLKDEFPLPDDFKFKLHRTNGKIRHMHCHDCLEIDYIERGTATYLVENNSYDMQPGDIMVINNSERHMIIPDKNCTILMLIFDLDFVWQYIHEYSYLDPFFHRTAYFSNRIRRQDAFYQELYDCMDKISYEYGLQEEGWQVMTRSYLIQILINLCRHYDKSESENEDILPNYPGAYDKLRPVVDYISDHFREQITLDTLADEAMMSRNYLCSFFKKTFGITIFEYIEQERINYCTMLLDSSDLSITEIAMKAGYNSISYFNRIFKRIKGCSPRQYRKNKAEAIAAAAATSE